MQIKIDPTGKIHSNFFAYEVLLVRTIYLFTLQEAEIVGNSRQSSSVVNSLGSFFMAPHKSSSCLWLFPFILLTLKKPYLFAPPGPTNITTMARQHTQFPLTFVYSLATRPPALHEIPTHRDILVQKGCFSNSSLCFWCYLFK